MYSFRMFLRLMARNCHRTVSLLSVFCIWGPWVLSAALPEPTDYNSVLIDSGSLPEELVELNGFMAESLSFKAKFIRSNYVAGIDIPVSATGYLLYDATRGLLWQTVDPYREALWVSQDGVFKMDAKGKEKVAEDPGVYLKVQEFIEGQMSAFGADGQLYFGTKKDSWELRFLPQGGALAGQLSEIRIQGSRGVLWWIRIVQKSKTVISIRLYDFQRFKQAMGETEFFNLKP